MTAAPAPDASPTDRRKLMVGKGWVQAVARALRAAVERDERITGIASTKGTL